MAAFRPSEIANGGGKMMHMTNETVLSEMRRAVPGFEIASDWSSDNLTFPVFNDFAGYICAEAEMFRPTPSTSLPRPPRSIENLCVFLGRSSR
jgi:hypothetical protein